MKMQELEYFVGKVCTVFTVLTNRNFQTENPQTYPEPMYHYFMGRILEVNTHGVILEQWAAGPKRLRSFFNLQHVISIAEEETLNPDDPMDAKIIQQYKEEYKTVEAESMKQVKENKLAIDQQKEEFLDITKLAELQKKMIGNKTTLRNGNNSP